MNDTAIVVPGGASLLAVRLLWFFIGKLPRATMTIGQLRSEAAAAMAGIDDSPRALGIALRCIYETAVCAPDGTTTRLFRMRVPVHDPDDAQVIHVEIGAHAEDMFVGQVPL